MGVRLTHRKLAKRKPSSTMGSTLSYRLIHSIIKNLIGRKLAKAKGKVLQPAPHLAGTKERLLLLEPCFKSVQYSPHSFKQKTRREGNTSCLLRKFIFEKQTLTYTVGRAGLLHSELCTRTERFIKTEEFFI